MSAGMREELCVAVYSPGRGVPVMAFMSCYPIIQGTEERPRERGSLSTVVWFSCLLGDRGPGGEANCEPPSLRHSLCRHGRENRVAQHSHPSCLAGAERAGAAGTQCCRLGGF